MTSTLLMQTLLESAARSLPIAAAAALALWALRVRSAQARHLTWSCVLAGSLCMPFLPGLLRQLMPGVIQEYPVTVIPATPLAAVSLPVVGTFSPAHASSVKATSTVDPLLAVYLAVASFLLIRLAIGLYLTWGITRRAVPLPEGQANTRISNELRTPVTFGRTILLPGNTHLWSEEMLGAVLRHEEAHCRRGDFYVQALSKLHRALFWFHPGAWWLDRELASLAEEACDDAAVRSQEECPVYAQVLLHFASKSRLSTEAGVAMARLSSVGKRVSRLLDNAFEPGSRHFTRSGKVKVLASMSALVILAAGYTVVLQAEPQSKPAQPSQASQPSQPATPTAPAKSRRTWNFGGDGTPFVLVENEHSVTMSGSSDDVRLARQQKLPMPYIWFREGGKEYVVRDNAAIEQVRELFRPQEELGRAQAALGERQAKLGSEQAKLGEQQASVQVDVPDMTEEMRKLTERIAALAKRRADVAELGDLQARLGEMQGRLGELQGRAGARQGELGKLQAELGAKQAALGHQQAELGQKQADAAQKARIRLEPMFGQWIREGKAKPVQ